MYRVRKSICMLIPLLTSPFTWSTKYQLSVTTESILILFTSEWIQVENLEATAFHFDTDLKPKDLHTVEFSQETKTITNLCYMNSSIFLGRCVQQI